MVISSSLQYFMKFHCSRVRLKSQLITTLHDTTLAQNSCTVYFHRKTASTQLASTTQWKKSTIACFYQENVWLAWLYPTIRYDCYFGGWIQNTVRSTKGVSVCQATIFTYLSSEEKAFLEGVCVCMCVCVCVCVCVCQFQAASFYDTLSRICGRKNSQSVYYVIPQVPKPLGTLPSSF